MFDESFLTYFSLLDERAEFLGEQPSEVRLYVKEDAMSLELLLELLHDLLFVHVTHKLGHDILGRFFCTEIFLAKV